jgi:4-oxalomesaconate tautomerase
MKRLAAVLGAVTVATACAIDGTVANGIAAPIRGGRMPIEHPSGEFTVELDVATGPDGPQVVRAALLRTARRLFAGTVAVPRSAFEAPGEFNETAQGEAA